MAEKDQQQGGVHIEAITIVNQYGEALDISMLSIGVRLYESIYSKFVTGDIAVMDGLNVLKNFRFTGQETVRISFKQQEGSGQSASAKNAIDKVFRVYNELRTAHNHILSRCVTLECSVQEDND